MEPAPHSCPHCLGQDEKRLLFRKATLSSPSNHASSHACSPSSVSEGGRGGEAGHFWELGTPEGSDIMCFSQSWAFYRELLTLVFLLVAQNRVALWGNGNTGVTVSSCESGTNARASAATAALSAVLKVCLVGGVVPHSCSTDLSHHSLS